MPESADTPALLLRGIKNPEIGKKAFARTIGRTIGQEHPQEDGILSPVCASTLASGGFMHLRTHLFRLIKCHEHYSAHRIRA